MSWLLIILGTTTAWDYLTQSTWPSECLSGNQSPISLDTDNTKAVESDFEMKMIFLGETTSRVVENTGNMIRVHADIGYIEVGEYGSKRSFDVKYLEFHTPSEHQLSGVSFPMEMQVIMEAQDKYIERDEANMAILSVLFQKGRENYFLNTLEVWNLHVEVGAYNLSATSNINIREVVWNTDEYYFYSGTATHPDYVCRDDVLWYVIQDVKEAEDWQINMFMNASLTPNNRKVHATLKQIYYSFSPHLGLFLIYIIL